MTNPYTTIEPNPSEALPAPYHLLPWNLGALADACERDRGRYGAMQGVSLAFVGDQYRAEATDGKILVRVEGESDSAADYPSLPALASAPNGSLASFIPAKEWKEAFRSLPKPNKAARPILRNVAVVCSPDVTTLATTDLDSASVRSPRNLEGRFPDTDSVLHYATEKPPTATVRVDAARLIDLLKILLPFTGGTDLCEVTLEVYPDGRPLILRTSTPSQQATALLMPLSQPK